MSKFKYFTAKCPVVSGDSSNRLKLSHHIFLILFLILLAGCNAYGSPQANPQPQDYNNYVGQGCAVQSPPENNEGNFKVVYVPLRLAL